MAGYISGVQARVREEIPQAEFYHCAAHRLNLVINATSSITEIRNTTTAIKSTIKFFRESTLRRKLIPNLPIFCETRWSHKYKSIRLFSENYEALVDALVDLERSSLSSTRTLAHQHLCTTATPTFLLAMVITAHYAGST